MSYLRLGVWLVLIPLLGGCMAATLVGGSMDNEVVVTIDGNSFSQSVQNTLRDARTLGIVIAADDRSGIKAADLFETRGGYTVRIDRQTAKSGEMTRSERREALGNVCTSKRPDVAMLGHVVKTESGHMVAAAFTGRAKLNMTWVMEILHCKTNGFDSFGGSLNMNIGIYKGTQPAELEEQIGAEIGGKILAALGRGGGGAVGSKQVANGATQATTPTDKVTAPQSSPDMVVSSKQATQADSRARSMTNIEVQKRLLALGYKAGVADGTMGKRTADALKKFQADNQLTVTGVADDETVAKLAQKAPGTPARSSFTSPSVKGAAPITAGKRPAADL